MLYKGWQVRSACYTSCSVGAWLSLVERSVRDREVAGSNPVAPTTSLLRFPTDNRFARQRLHASEQLAKRHWQCDTTSCADEVAQRHG